MQAKDVSEWVVSWKQIGIVILAFSLGLISALIVNNSQSEVQTSFSTTELIAFTLSVVLSGASIVLAISAIALGKSSEQAVIKRSDESIRLQNDVFVKTTEALQRIEASTGVTEKRIEDIISGRVGDISQQVAQMATSGTKGGFANVKDLEERLRKSLMTSLLTARNPETKEKLIKTKEIEEEREELYQINHEKLLLNIGNTKDVKIEKLGHGSIVNEGDQVFDAIYTKGDMRFAVSTIRPDIDSSILQRYLFSIAKALKVSSIIKVAIVLFSSDIDSEINQLITEQLSNMREEISQKLFIVFACYDDIDSVAHEIVSKL